MSHAHYLTQALHMGYTGCWPLLSLLLQVSENALATQIILKRIP